MDLFPRSSGWEGVSLGRRPWPHPSQVLGVPFPPTFSFHRAQRGAGLSILQAEPGRRKKGSKERDRRGRKRKSLHQQIGGWVGGWMDGWIDGWVGIWTKGRAWVRQIDGTDVWLPGGWRRDGKLTQGDIDAQEGGSV